MHLFRGISENKDCTYLRKPDGADVKGEDEI